MNVFLVCHQSYQRYEFKPPAAPPRGVLESFFGEQGGDADGGQFKTDSTEIADFEQGEREKKKTHIGEKC